MNKAKPQATVQKSEKKKNCNWVTLSTILSDSNIWTSSNLLHLVHLVHTKRCSSAHIINGLNLTFLNPTPYANPNRNPNRESIFLAGNFSDTGKKKRKERQKRNKK